MAEGKTRDPRVDRFISWALSAIVAAALLWSVNTFGRLEETITELSDDVTGLSTEVQVLGERMVQLSKIEKRLDDHIEKDGQAAILQRLDDHDRRMANLEK